MYDGEERDRRAIHGVERFLFSLRHFTLQLSWPEMDSTCGVDGSRIATLPE
jgi:hypothetical protein